MKTKEEQTKLKNELLHAKPNPFEWSNYKEYLHKKMRKRIMENPYDCGECGDTYNKDHLIKIQADRVCKNCLCSG